MFKLNLTRKQTGFTMIEVLLAILTVTLFLTGTLQLIAINTFYKMKNKQEAQASFWIQEDLEEVRSLATNTNLTASCYPTRVNQTYAYALQLAIQNQDTDPNSPLPGASPKALLVSNTTQSPNAKMYKMVREYSINFDDNSNTIDQPTVLKINYKVEDINASSLSRTLNRDINRDPVIATQYAEVIPNESFNCN
jgi:Tfp pilus assembly protein PilV